MTGFWHDVRSGLRLLRAKPGFTALAVATLAIGIGANTAIFTAVDALLLRPLPLDVGDRLVFGYALREGFDPFGTSLLEYNEYRQSPALASSGVAIARSATLAGRDEPERVAAAAVSAGYLSTIGVQPLAGRTFADQDDRPGAPAVALIGYDLWQRRFGGQSIVGQSMMLDDGAYTVIGVMPRGFDLPAAASLWIPLRIDVATAPIEQRQPTAYEMVARLAEGVSLAQADAALKTIAMRLEEEFPQIRRGWTYRLIPLRQQLLGDLAGRNRLALLYLEAAVAFLLLICCANVANLVLARGVAREREVAVRHALGASRGRIVRQLMIESALLATAGGVAGVLLSLWLVPLLATLNPIRAGALSLFLTDFTINGRAAAFALTVSLCSGLLFGVAPALRTGGRRDAMTVLRRRDQDGGAIASRGALGLLVIAEIAIAVALLVNGALIVQSFSRLQHVDLGFDADHVLTLQVTLPSARASTHAERMRLVDRLADRLRSVPGVIAAGLSTNMPLQHLSIDTVFTVEGRPPINPADVPITAHRMVTPGYLRALGVRLVAGRLLEETDRETTTPVVVISEELARQAWPGAQAIGKRLRRGRPSNAAAAWMTVVGVVADVKEDRFNFRTARPVWYVPYAQSSVTGPLSVVARADGDASAVARDVRAALRSVDAELAISHVVPMRDHIADLFVTERFSALLMTTLASIGLFLAIGGLYGVTAYTASRRTREIGLRMALGAKRRDVLRLVIGQNIRLVAAGVLAGAIVARIVGAALSDALFAIRPDDPLTYWIVAAVLAIVGTLACLVPSMQAARVDPLVALRTE
jgi:putative ABC transport system permease protein